MRLIKISISALLVGTMIMLAFPASIAYPLLEDGGGEYWVPPYIPPTSPPPSAPPALPDCGYFTVDCPSGGWMVDFVNVYDEYAVVHRNGPASVMYSTPFVTYSLLARGWFPDSSQAYQWPEQVMPSTNATIMSVYLIAVARSSGADVLAYMQYSTDGNQNYHPTNITNFTVLNADDYDEYLINVTWAENWTAAMLLSPDLYVRMISLGPSATNPIYVDYIGLRYNWTFVGAPPAGPGWNWPNSTLGKLTNASLLIGVLGTIGFVGMIVSPAVGIMMARNAEDRGPIIGKAALAMLACFVLFWMAIH